MYLTFDVLPRNVDEAAEDPVAAGGERGRVRELGGPDEGEEARPTRWVGSNTRVWHRRRPRLAGGCRRSSGARLGSGRVRQGRGSTSSSETGLVAGACFARVVWRVVMSMHFLMLRIICLRFVLPRVDVTVTRF